MLGHKDNCTDVIGIYPLLENDTCKFIVFDFDNHDEESIDNNDWKDEVNALRKICEESNIDVLIERSSFWKWGTCLDSIQRIYISISSKRLWLFTNRKRSCIN